LATQSRPAAPDTLLCVSRGLLQTVTTYLLLFVLGAMEAVIGCFEYPYVLGPVPVAALGFCLLVFATCLLAGAGLGSPGAALTAAAGWFAASLALSQPTSGGSVIVTNTSAGKWYLYGGAVSAAVGLGLTFSSRLRGPVSGPGRGA
jgi:hypothetical protein